MSDNTQTHDTPNGNCSELLRPSGSRNWPSGKVVRETECFGCSKKRRCIKIGSYKYQGSEWPIWSCQWCRASDTRRKKREYASENSAVRYHSDKQHKIKHQ